MAITYKRFRFEDLPPSLKKQNLTYQNLNHIILEAYHKTIISHQVDKSNPKDISLPDYLVDEVKKVVIQNRTAEPLTYVVTNTDKYIIKLNRELKDDEKLLIEYTIRPASQDALRNKDDFAYIRSDIYKTLIELLYNYAKVQPNI